MRTYDTKKAETMARDGKRTEVMHQASHFKIRMIELPLGGSIPPCEMASSVIFHVMSGTVDITSDGETVTIMEGQGVVSEPATVSMMSTTGARLLGIQIENPQGERNE